MVLCEAPYGREWMSEPSVTDASCRNFWWNWVLGGRGQFVRPQWVLWVVVSVTPHPKIA